MTAPVESSAALDVVGGLRTNARRFETYVRISLYLILAFELPFAGLIVVSLTDQKAWLIVFGIGMALQTVLNIAACRWALTTMRRTTKLPSGRDRTMLITWVGVSLALWVCTAVLITDAPQWRFVVLAVIIAPVSAVAPLLNRRWLVLTSAAIMVVIVAVLGVGYAAVMGWGFVLGVSAGLLISVVAVVASFWASGWMLRVVWALDDARGQAAQLAIAEERLRIARDLHDVFGRTLATVAVKSELAAELVRRGRSAEAATEIAAVRAIADDAGREVRQVVRGVRAADLATELAGARALLDSAGIRCEVIGGPSVTLDPQVAAVVAWALREAVTNVIRHSAATHCRIQLSVDRVVRLQVENDGAIVGPVTSSPESTPESTPQNAPDKARPTETESSAKAVGEMESATAMETGTATDPGGHGLLGMSERVAAVGGHVTHQVRDGWFVLQVAAPLRPGLAVAS